MVIEQVIKKSGSGSTKWVDNIYFDILDAKTHAASILLKNYYFEHDIDNIYSIANRMRMIGFSRKYLTHIKKTTGDLVCTYCHKPQLIIEREHMKVPNFSKATIDHIQALSEGGARFDYANICVACGKCNSRKGSLSVEDFLKIIRKNEKVILPLSL